jgi:hypothetical protein
MRERSGRIVTLAAVLLAVALPASARADTPWSVGAAKVDITPALFSSAQDLVDFPEVDLVRGMTCPRAVYSGPRVWRFEEPYQDTDGSGLFNYVSGGSGSEPVPEPYCDYNHNGRWEGIYLSGGADYRAVVSPNPIPGAPSGAHDPLDARAVAFSDGTKNVVLVSVVSQGIFENYTAEARAMAQALAGLGAHAATCGQIDEMVISANHNESSPDSIGIYGAPPDPTGTFGLHSGIDEYYMDWLNEQIASAAVEACDGRQPASLRAAEFPVPSDLEQEIPGRFPTTADSRQKPAAIDNKVRVLQARDANDDPIFTMMNLADHNQDLGHADTLIESHTMSADWPGYFHRHLEADIGGMAMFVAADIGSMEDLITNPRIPDPPCNSGGSGCYPQVDLTGETIANHVAAEIASGTTIPPGAVNGRRTEFCVPLENNVFLAAGEAGIFGERQLYTNCQPTGRAGDQVFTSVSVLDVGSDLQFIGEPSEAFPALMLGGPWGIEDASCPNRANPPVPTWYASARYRFQIGLADDLLGYLKPAWSFLFDTPGFFTPTDCTSDPHGHSHSLEDESVGWTAGNLVAEELTNLLDDNPDPAAEVRLGRYVKADGSLTNTTPIDQVAPGHFPPGAVAIWLAAPGETNLNATPGQPDSGTIVALDSVGTFGSRPVDYNGAFMDFDGAQDSTGPGLMTRGMLVRAIDGSVQKRYYVDVYPALTVSGALDPALPYVGYARPKGATPVNVTLVPAYDECSDQNGSHGAPLAVPSCNPPVQSSGYLTVGTPDANGKPANATGKVILKVLGESPIDFDNGDQADVQITAGFTDVRNKPDLSDYTGELRALLGLRITDGFNGTSLRHPATAADAPLGFTVTCSPTAGGEGGACNLTTTVDAMMTDVAREGKRAVWGLSQVRVFDGGADGDADTAGDNTLFAVQGLFAP